ncbi:uncharacterized protein C8A04DRAFT_31911 [Dichotomopilus funicola]|uniref:Uncharacterized protein n=1 Tax=Dichotomopilus funicola TaxID=1934379 RepID=A0AAN6UX09_9PEZI|nr:hypothetical protein C8A04DRAFT_31911 [Dichotomopilus funicola]
MYATPTRTATPSRTTTITARVRQNSSATASLPTRSNLAQQGQPGPSNRPIKHVRFQNTELTESEKAWEREKERRRKELSGQLTFDTPGPKENPIDWTAGAITVVSVLLAGLWMLRSKRRR